MTTSSGDKKPLTGRNQLVKDNLIAPILSAPSSSIAPGVSSTMTTPISATIATPTPGKLNPKVTVVNEEPMVTDNSVNQTSIKSSNMTNRDYSTGNPNPGLYA